MNKALWEIKDPLPKNLKDWFFWIKEHTTCKLGWHKQGDHKFNGGNTCWLCKYCRLIIKYDSEG